ncbi:MAG: beta-lactamase family protein, partial [Eubacteriaceae bacterium]|nr:beta-lactamase family protein [Eubacteriaceae bacterium]
MTDLNRALEKAFRETAKGKDKGGFAAAVFDRDGVFFTAFDDFSDKKNGTRPGPDSLFMIGSNTKVLDALGIFRLYEEGKLSLTDPVTRFIPEFRVKSRTPMREVTVADLLMHRGGIRCDLYEYLVDGPHSLEDIVPALADTYTTRRPGTMFSYSNLGYGLIGIIESRITGKSYPEFLSEWVLEPLGMEAYLGPEKTLPEEVRDRVARSYSKNGRRVYDPLGTLLPAGTCTYTTPMSLARVGIMFLNNGTIDGKQFLRPETVELMETLKISDVLDETIACIGYGLYHHNLPLRYETGRTLGHGGDTIYHHSTFDFLPQEKVGAVVMGNFDGAAPLVRQISRELFNAYLSEKGFPEKKDTAAPAEDRAEKLTGKYDTRFGQLDFAESEDGTVHFTIKDMQAKLTPYDNGWSLCEETVEEGKEPSESFPAGLMFRPAKYFGYDILLSRQNGITQAAGIIHEEPGRNEAWEAAYGKY